MSTLTMKFGGTSVGSPEAIFHRPQTRFVAEFMGQTDFIPGTSGMGGIETPLGVVPQDLPLPEGTQVEVAVRPDDVRVSADGPFNGTVLSRQFVGIAHIYRVGLADGTIVHSWAAHTVNLPAGSPVHVSLQGDHPLACFHNGGAAI